ncbi:MAG: glutamate-1-semialdehyde 2,1-aminomutase [Saprospiraceae bacterium]|nr:glutamate-1-semialdehyde 2,1-aminomutase [Saprospiraceae bacterium]
MEFPERQNSSQLFEEAKKYFPGGVNSPVRAFKSVYGPPLFIKKGSGCHIICEDDHQYIDFCASWGPMILGHDDPDVREAIISTVSNGASFGAPTKLGNRLGSLIIKNHRYLEQLRFVSSGTEAVMSAIRLARGYTGKSKIVKFEGCYHGHADSLLVKAGSGLVTFGVSTSAGVPPSFVAETIVLPLDDLEALSACFAKHHDLAAVIIEPIPANNGLLLQNKEYLQALRSMCTDNGVLLIFDEVISGFRVGFEGAAGLYEIEPDILTFGKIIGGGLPVGAFGARREIMQHISPDGNVYQAGTLSANPVAMAAGYATLVKVMTAGFYEQLEAKTHRFVTNLTEHIVKNGFPMQIVQIGSIFWLCFSPLNIRRADQIDPGTIEYFKKLHLYLLRAGIYLGPSGYEVGFISDKHDDMALDEAAAKISKGLDFCFND